ncbi:MAG TPA: SAM-dependent chlorinase/fluorinase [Bacteroidia bacterium]|nr:SAM-dependent chlorinase/fluorinase [Bacteroidia bacterium]
MPVITLTTDMGHSGFYVASVKAAIIMGIPEATIIDITHSIRAFHVSSAAFIIRNVYKQFPEGTVHIVAVDALNSPNARVIAIKTEGHYFIGPDNGLFSLVFNAPPTDVFEITIPANPSSLAFTAKDIMAKAAVHIAKGGSIAEIGQEYNNYTQLTAWQPIYNDATIRTSVVYVDEYGNCIFNLDKTLFEQVGKGRKFSIDVKRNSIETISDSYNNVSGGELVALFTGSGLLEIAINKGNISELLGLKEGDSVLISFE